MDQLVLPNASDWINAYEAGQKVSMTRQRQQALADAGGYMSSGDYQGAAKALFPYEPTAGVAMLKAGSEAKKQADADAKQQAVSSAIMKGDFTGAFASAAGDSDLTTGVEKAVAHAHETAGALASTGLSLKKLPYEQRAAALAQAKPYLLSRGLTPDKIDGFDPTDANIDAVVNDSLGIVKAAELAAPKVVGKALVTPEGKPLYTDPTIEKLGQGETLVSVGGPDGQGGAPAPTAPAPTSVAAAPQAAPTAPPADAPRGLRNNNPLNLRPLDQGQWDGQTGVDDSGYAKFATEQDGWNAAHKNLIAYGAKHGINTIAGVVARWAPAGKDGNDPQAYAATVAKSLGMDPNQPIDLNDQATRERVLSAMANVELGQPYAGPGAAASQPAAAAPAPTPITAASGVKVLAVGAPKEEKKAHPASAAEKAAYGIAPDVPAQVRADGSIAVISGAAGTAAGLPPGADPNLTGDAFLKSVPATQANQIKALAEGRLQFPSGMALRTPYWQGMLQAVGQYDPSFDATKFNNRNQTRVAFTKGVQGQNLNSIQTLLGHLDDLNNAIDGLPNGNIPMLNAAGQFIRSNMGDTKVQGALSKYQTARAAVAAELVRALRGTGGTLGDEKHWLSVFDPAQPKDAQKQAIQEAVSLIGGRIDPLRATYQEAMGPNADPLVELYPRAAQIYQRLGGDVSEVSGQKPTAASTPAPSAPAPPAIGEVRKGYRFKGGDPANPNSWVKVQ